MLPFTPSITHRSSPAKQLKLFQAWGGGGDDDAEWDRLTQLCGWWWLRGEHLLHDGEVGETTFRGEVFQRGTCICWEVCDGFWAVTSGPRLASRLRMFLSDICSLTATGGILAMVAGRRVTSAFMSLSSSSSCLRTGDTASHKPKLCFIYQSSLI